MRRLVLFGLLLTCYFCVTIATRNHCGCPDQYQHPQAAYCQSQFVILAKPTRKWDQNDIRYVNVTLIEILKITENENQLTSKRYWYIALDKKCYPRLRINQMYLISGVFDNFMPKVSPCDYFECLDMLSPEKRRLLSEVYVNSCRCKIEVCAYIPTGYPKSNCGVIDNVADKLISKRSVDRYMRLEGFPRQNGLRAHIDYYHSYVGQPTETKDICCLHPGNQMENYTCLPKWLHGSCVWTVNNI